MQGATQSPELLFADSSFALARKIDQVLNFWKSGQIGFNPAERICDGQTLREREFCTPASARDSSFLLNTISLHPLLVYKPGFGWVSIRGHKGRNILHHLGTATDDRHLSDAAKLMDCGKPANHRMIFHSHVTSQSGHVGHDNAIADSRHVVRYVAVRKNVIIGAHRGRFTVRSRAVDRRRIRGWYSSGQCGCRLCPPSI